MNSLNRDARAAHWSADRLRRLRVAPFGRSSPLLGGTALGCPTDLPGL
jgi:hypothetical protein